MAVMIGWHNEDCCSRYFCINKSLSSCLYITARTAAICCICTEPAEITEYYEQGMIYCSVSQ